MKSYMLALVVVATLASGALLQPAFAEGMRQTSSGGSLVVEVEPQWDQNQFQISFLQPNGNTVQQHIDYEVTIVDSSGNPVYSAVEEAGVPGQPTLHTGEGVIHIPANPPVEFPENGEYTIDVKMTGILFNPIPPETAEFPITVTPEFPVGVFGAVAAAVSGMIAVTRLKRI